MPIAYVGLYFTDLTPDMFPPATFGGVFRLPFAMNEDRKVRPHRFADAFYLGDNGEFIPVRPDERGLGYATVRVEIEF